jgi:1,2-diacylglycerol 3-alpha-glucosyltransferase
MRIGFFSDRYLPLTDGIAFSIEDFRLQLEQLGHEVYIFAPRAERGHKDTSKHIIRFPAVKGLFFEDYMTTFFFPPQVMKRIEKLNLDVIHFHTPGQIGLMGAYFAVKHNIPLLTTYHTDLYEYVKHYPSVLPGTIALSMLAPVITGGGMAEYRLALSSIKPERSVDKWNQKIVERGVTLIHNHCDVVITPSVKMERQLKRWKTKSRLVTLPTGVDKITTKSKDIAKIREQFRILPTDKIILSVGRIGTEKNLGTLIKAFDVIGKKEPTARLLFVGKGDDLDAFREQAAGSPYHDRILFAGRIDRAQLGALYGTSHVFAFPSVADTQGLVLSEAALAGLPIVMVDRDVTSVVRDGENGYFAKNNPKDLAAKILKVLSNESRRVKLGQRGIELAQEYSAGKQALKLLRLYEETIERHHASQNTPDR